MSGKKAKQERARELNMLVALVEWDAKTPGLCQCGRETKDRRCRMSGFRLMPVPAGEYAHAPGSDEESAAADRRMRATMRRQLLGDFQGVEVEPCCADCAAWRIDTFTNTKAGALLLVNRLIADAAGVPFWTAFLMRTREGHGEPLQNYVIWGHGSADLRKIIRAKPGDPSVDEIQLLTINPDGTMSGWQ